MDIQNLNDQEVLRNLTQLMAEALRRGIDVPSITEDATTASALRLKAYEAKKAKEAKDWSIKSAVVKAIQAIGYGYFELNEWSPRINRGSDDVRYYFSLGSKTDKYAANYSICLIVNGNHKYPKNYTITSEKMRKDYPDNVARLSKLLPVVYHDLMNPSFNTELVADIEPSPEYLKKYLEILGVDTSATPELATKD